MKKHINQAFLVIFISFIISFLINSFDIYAQYRCVAPDGSEDILYTSMMLIIPPLLGAILTVVSIPFLVFRKTRHNAAIVILAALSYILTFIMCVRIGGWVRMNAFKKLADRSTTLVSAIHEYEKVHGIPPKKLEALIPEFINAISKTGMGAYPAYEYEVFPESQCILVWYDLGKRKTRKLYGLWKYPEGKSGNAIVTFSINSKNKVIKADVDGMPEKYEQIPFNIDLWRQNKLRIEMICSLIKTKKLEGKSSDELIALLGKPDGQRILRDSKWELRVPCPSGGLNWDVFFYWPSKNYPNYIYGGSVERIGDWAYVHE